MENGKRFLCANTPAKGNVGRRAWPCSPGCVAAGQTGFQAFSGQLLQASHLGLGAWVKDGLPAGQHCGALGEPVWLAPPFVRDEAVECRLRGSRS
jgi:hypothetical protein